MRLARIGTLLLCTFMGAGLACGTKKKASHRDGATAAAANPTPDNTPIAALRTPAGWLLVKAERTAAAATPTPSAAPAPSPNPKP